MDTPDGNLTAAFESAVNAAKTMAPSAPIEQVLVGLAAVPSGAGIPLELFAKAVADNSDTPGDELAVRDALVALGELAARTDPGNAKRMGRPGSRTDR